MPAAAVVDLEEFRKRRQARHAAAYPTPAAQPVPSASWYLPVCLVWMPVWRMA